MISTGLLSAASYSTGVSNCINTVRILSDTVAGNLALGMATPLPNPELPNFSRSNKHSKQACSPFSE